MGNRLEPVASLAYSALTDAAPRRLDQNRGTKSDARAVDRGRPRSGAGAYRSAVAARVCGLNEGADDYLVKPFDVDKLHARLLAVLRRQSGYLGKSLTCGHLSFDLEIRVAHVDGTTIARSVLASELLELLLRRAGNVVPKRISEEHLLGLGSNQVKAASGARIETIRGVGHVIV